MRDEINYAEANDAKFEGLPTDWLPPGYYKVRQFKRGPWIPVEITLVDGERDPETFELLSDQELAAKWWPRTNSTRSFDVPAQWFFNRAHPIERSEFEWLIALRNIRK